jgi:hypothetical protein
MRTRLLISLIVLSSCGETDQLASTNPHNPYEDGATTVIGGDENVPVASGQVNDEGCLQITAETCTEVAREGKYCKTDEGPADAIVVDGVIVEVVCYEDTDGSSGPTKVIGDVPQQDNGAVITFDPSTDGKPIAGDVVVDGNNVTIYGNGPDNSIIDGNLTITGNNARVRGVRVTGDLLITLNTAAVVFSVIEGNVRMETNNSLLAECEVYGNVEVPGNNCILVNNRVGGQWNIGGQGAICDGNTKRDDETAALSCALSP